jgi:acetyl-CoA carboxylase biotin carboxyl carrier protein
MIESLPVRVEPLPQGGSRVLSPRIGLWSAHPEAGRVVEAGQEVGVLSQGNRRWRLVLPPAAGGRVAADLPRDRVVPVAFGTALFTLTPLTTEAAPIGAPEDAAPPAAGDLPRGSHAIAAPTDGIFHRRPAPDAPPFVETGARIQRGQPVGLVEVMKTFNQILYGGASVPDSATVLETRVADGEEVRAGQVLFVVG